MMFQTVTTIIKWTSVPALLAASMFSFAAGQYEPLLSDSVALCAIFFIERAVRSKEYSWAAGLIAVVIVCSPIVLTVKIFALMGLTCVATFAFLFAVFRARPLPTS
jgi:hypothetical protein